MGNQYIRNTSRRGFIKGAIQGYISSSILMGGFPTIVPASVFGRKAPGNRINVAAIGTGRISRGHDLPGVWKYDNAQIVAVCDLDSKRVEDGRKLVNDYYAGKTGKTYDGVKTYRDYRKLLRNKDIDAVLISTPDHWHALIAIQAV